MKKVEGAKWEAQRPADRSEAAHSERMAQLDKDRYTLAKSVNELELALQREDAILIQLQERTEAISSRTKQLDAQEIVLGEDRIRSIVYREMGLSWAIDEVKIDEQGRWTDSPLRCRVMSRKENDVFTLNFAPGATTPYEDANRLWSLLAQ